MLKTVSKKIDKPVYNENYLKARIIPIMENSTQIFIMINYQKKVLNILRISNFNRLSL